MGEPGDSVDLAVECTAVDLFGNDGGGWRLIESIALSDPKERQVLESEVGDG